MPRIPTFTDAGVRESLIEDEHGTDADAAIDGETSVDLITREIRYHFALLLGEGRPCWSSDGGWLAVETPGGLVWVCVDCWQYARLPSYAYCLTCDRCGQDHRIATPTERELAALGRRVYEPDPDLAGGIGRSLAARARAG